MNCKNITKKRKEKNSLNHKQENNINKQITKKETTHKKNIDIVKILCVLGVILTVLLITNEMKAASKYAKSADDIKVTIKGTDLNYFSNSLTANQITTKIGSQVVTPTIELSTALSITNGIQYVATLKGMPTNISGDLSLAIAANNLTDKAENKNIQITITTGIEIDNNKPSYTSYEIKNETSSGYDVYIYGVSDEGAGLKEVRFPTWTSNNGQDDLPTSWETNPVTLGTNQGNGTWYYRVNKTDHNNEEGTYKTNIVICDNVGNKNITETTGEVGRGIYTKVSNITETSMKVTANMTRTDDVEKYYFSKDNGATWDIMKYTSTFPMTEMPIEVGSLINNGTYYFTTSGTTLIPNNGGVHNSVANSYIPIDLTKYEESTKLKLKLNASISSESNYDYGYATITNTTTAPVYSSTTGRFMYISGVKLATDYITELTGGQKYYLHIGYRKDSSGNTGTDKVTINNITIEGLKGNSYIYNNLTQGTTYNIKTKAVLKDGKEIISGTKEVKIHKVVPVLGSEMTPIKWNGTTEVETTEVDSNWYNYETNNWANAKTADGSYWVWIPRYEYKILSGEGTSTKGEIDVKFIPTSKTTPTAGYKIHPAFENGSATGKNNNYMNGEWDKELSGIWVAKYEMSMETNGIATDISNDTIGNVLTNSNIKAVSKPGVTSWRRITIGNMYTNAYNYDRGKESHMMKNSEWGAVAYLTHSKYGRNKIEVTINSNSSYYTGGGSGESYKTNTNQSSTGNVTGIYDLSGGAYEFTAAYISNGNRYLSNGSSLVGGNTAADLNGYKTKSSKTVTVYPYGGYDSSLNNYSQYKSLKTRIYGYGDAVLETSTSGGDSTSWNSDYRDFPNTTYPFFGRGGVYNDGASAGLFAFDFSDVGDGSVSGSFRLVLSL